LERKVKKQQNDHKLEVGTEGYTSGGLMKEEIITFSISWDLPHDSRRMSHHIQRKFSTGCYHIELFTDIFQLLVEQTVPRLLVILFHDR
jgi:hypothetical protein